MDMEGVAKQNVPIAHWGYQASGVDDDLTVKANRDGYQRIELRPRRLIDVSHTDIKVDLLGTTYNLPIFICPTGGHKMFHPDGEEGTARAAKAKGAMQILSTVASTGIEAVVAARGGPVWYQMYAPSKWEGGVDVMLKRVEAAGTPVVALTVDLTGGRNTETYRRARRLDTRDCSLCHDGEPGGGLDTRPMFKGIDLKTMRISPPNLDWTFVDRLKKSTKMKVVIKGLETHEDAKLAVEHGVDGILVSNHGGRSAESLRPTIASLPEVVEAVGGRVPIFMDGGIRRGTDALKALALGARAVGIGRPYLWGLGAFGEAGVERVLEILQAELLLAMRQCGVPTLASINRTVVAPANQLGF
jgi:4-hydroxymandelate oxidase